MARNRTSAKRAGAKFEKDVADYMAEHIDDRIERRTMGGSLDRGDIGGIRTRHNEKVVVEVKNVTKQALPQWINEAHQEAENDGALVGVVVAKRHGNGNIGDQWLHMTLRDFSAILTGVRPK